MKNVKFLGGLSAIAFAAMSVVGLTLTSCEEEDLTVADTNITVTTPDVQVTVEGTEVTETQGVVYLTISAVNTSGVALTGVTFTVTGSATGTYADVVGLSLTSAGTFGVTASKTDYVDTYQVISTPDPVAGTLVVYSITMVLQSEEEKAAEDGTSSSDTVEVDVEAEELTETEIEAILYESAEEETVSGSYSAGQTIEVVVEYADDTAYLTDEQRTAIVAAIDALTGATSLSAATRADDTNLALAKTYLKAKVAELPSKPNYAEKTLELTFDEDASAYTITTTEKMYTRSFTLSATVSGNVYAVEGSQTVVYDTEYEFSATGVETGHSHDSHGTDTNAGGGTTTE